ncbi:MAG: heme o synthase [Proteobacteria bacterium]|nr:heme o synthase [Pseudomonadota bacterium]
MSASVGSLAAEQSPSSLIRDLCALMKPRVTVLVVATAAIGMWLAPDPVPPLAAVLTGLAIGLVVGSANTLNCWLERDVDGLMKRTRMRPLPQGRLRPATALGFGLLLAAVSIPMLVLATNSLTGLLAATALVSYVAIYTPLKRRSAWALPVGAIPGAIPPLMGWTSATGRLDAPGLVLFAILFLWQLPHFIAISVYRKSEYAGAGLKVLPVALGDRAAVLHAVAYAGALVPITLLLVPLGAAGTLYLSGAAVLGLAFFTLTLAGLWQQQSARWARRVFLASLLYLPLLFVLLAFDVA